MSNTEKQKESMKRTIGLRLDKNTSDNLDIIMERLNNYNSSNVIRILINKEKERMDLLKKLELEKENKENILEEYIKSILIDYSINKRKMVLLPNDFYIKKEDIEVMKRLVKYMTLFEE